MKILYMPVSTHEDPESVIPHGYRCSQITSAEDVWGTSQDCPFLAYLGGNHYCHLLGTRDSDWGREFFILRREKVCDINTDKKRSDGWFLVDG